MFASRVSFAEWTFGWRDFSDKSIAVQVTEAVVHHVQGSFVDLYPGWRSRGVRGTNPPLFSKYIVETTFYNTCEISCGRMQNAVYITSSPLEFPLRFPCLLVWAAEGNSIFGLLVRGLWSRLVVENQVNAWWTLMFSICKRRQLDEGCLFRWGGMMMLTYGTVLYYGMLWYYMVWYGLVYVVCCTSLYHIA